MVNVVHIDSGSSSLLTSKHIALVYSRYSPFAKVCANYEQYVVLSVFIVNMRIPSGMVAKSIEVFVPNVGGDTNCRFTGHETNPNPEGLFLRVAKRFLSYARHFSLKNLDWDTKI